MKILRYVTLVTATILLPFLFQACDDSGVAGDKTKSNFTQSHLPVLALEDGVRYELFVTFNDSLAGLQYRSCGKFNIDLNGNPVDSAGNVKTFKFSYTPDFSRAVNAFVTLEPLSDPDSLPNGTKIIGGAATLNNGALNFNMSMDFPGVVPGVPNNLGDSCRYIMATPTDSIGNFQFYRGVWLTTDTMGNTAGMSSPALDTNWIYHAWLGDYTNPGYPVFYNMGRFSNPAAGDDYAGCQGPRAGYNKPGQDYISTQTGCTSFANLNLGNFKMVVTLEPRNWVVQSKPAPIRIFFGNVGVWGFGIPSALSNVSAGYLPTALLVITTN